MAIKSVERTQRISSATAKEQREADLSPQIIGGLREKRELAWGLGNVIAIADIVVINEGCLAKLKEKMNKILS